jgi:hypothetical protein
MRRGWAIVATVLGVLLVVGVGIGAYNAGLDAGVRQGAGAGHVVEVVGGPGYGWHGYGFFPFGFLFFPLLLIGVIFLVRFAFGGQRRWGPGGWGTGGWGHAPWPEESRSRFEERFDDWHRRQHAQTSTGTDPEGGSDLGEGSSPA